MTTYTFRCSAGLAGRLNSAQMRTWIAEFLRQPHHLPPDLGPGEERISLTLPAESVQQLAEFLRCSPSQALRVPRSGAFGVFTRNCPGDRSEAYCKSGKGQFGRRPGSRGFQDDARGARVIYYAGSQEASSFGGWEQRSRVHDKEKVRRGARVLSGNRGCVLGVTVLQLWARKCAGIET
jgi:hypothetical protein